MDNHARGKKPGNIRKIPCRVGRCCMALGLILSQTIPEISTALNAWQIRRISVPIGKWLNSRGY